jgi:hypothetical protein
MQNNWKCALAFTGALLVGPAMHSQEECSTEIKFQLSPPVLKTVITALSFENEKAGQVDFFDTENRDLLKSGLIVRVRRGAANDLTLKVRVPAKGTQQAETSQLRQHFQCEIDRNGAGEDISYAVGRKYKSAHAPQSGDEISRALSESQKNLLRMARIPVDWTRVKRVATINSRSWDTRSQPGFRRIVLEIWEWPENRVLEVSTRGVGTGTGQQKSIELQELMSRKGLLLSDQQGNKTSTVLVGAPAADPRP